MRTHDNFAGEVVERVLSRLVPGVVLGDRPRALDADRDVLAAMRRDDAALLAGDRALFNSVQQSDAELRRAMD